MCCYREQKERGDVDVRRLTELANRYRYVGTEGGMGTGIG